MSVTEYLERARECAEFADQVSGKAKATWMEIAKAWLKLADEAAKVALKNQTMPAPPIQSKKN